MGKKKEAPNPRERRVHQSNPWISRSHHPSPIPPSLFFFLFPDSSAFPISSLQFRLPQPSDPPPEVGGSSLVRPPPLLALSLSSVGAGAWCSPPFPQPLPPSLSSPPLPSQSSLPAVVYCFFSADIGLSLH